MKLDFFSKTTVALFKVVSPPDNSLVIQSRVIMLDAFVIFLSYFSILCYLKFYHLRHQ